MNITDGINKISVNWSLAEELFHKWGYEYEADEILVRDIKNITPELNAWGIPWQFVSKEN